MRLFLVSLLATGAFVAPARAQAFCRTTTSQVPPDYDPAVSGCWAQGTPLAWPSGRVPYGVAVAASRQVPLADATRIADLAFSAWRNATCSGGPPNIDPFDDGPISTVPEAGDCTVSGTCDPAARDVIVFDDSKWPHNDSTNSLALTTVTYGVDDGRIFEAYTEVNSAEHTLTIQEPPPANSAAYDLQAILTHEAGHFLGLAHATETSSIMYAFYHPAAIEPTADDVSGICSVYPPSGPTSGGCSSSVARTASGSWVLGAALLALCTGRRASASRRRKARRTRGCAPLRVSGHTENRRRHCGSLGRRSCRGPERSA